MGWMWSSSSPPEAPKPSQPEMPTTSLHTDKPLAPATSAPNEATDPEIQKFFDLFQTDTSAKSPSPSASPQQQPPSDDSSSSSWLSSLRPSRDTTSTHVEPAPPGDALSESLLPTDMSCRQAFDQAWACNSMGGQWNAVYRYGAMRSCSEHWDDFWFCMRTKSYSGEMRENMIRAHYRNKEHAKYAAGKPSSEDVWESRDEKVQPGSVFTEKIE